MSGRVVIVGRPFQVQQPVDGAAERDAQLQEEGDGAGQAHRGPTETDCGPAEADDGLRGAFGRERQEERGDLPEVLHAATGTSGLVDCDPVYTYVGPT